MSLDETRLDSRTDAELLHRGAPETAFRELYRRHHGAVHGFLVQLLRDAAAADDVVQETFLRVHRNREKHDPSQPVRPWLFRIARNLGLNALRAKGRRTRKTGGDAATAATSDRLLLDAALSESREAAREALDALPDETRALLIQRHGLDMSLDELARSWNLNERTIRTRLQAAVDQLTQALLARRTGGVS